MSHLVSFRQLYVIRVVVDDTAVFCVYALLTGKSQTLHEEMLHAVVTKCEELRCSADPTTIVCDLSWRQSTPFIRCWGVMSQFGGCFYHLCQSTWRKIQELGLAQLYKDNNEVKVFCGVGCSRLSTC